MSLHTRKLPKGNIMKKTPKIILQTFIIKFIVKVKGQLPNIDFLDVQINNPLTFAQPETHLTEKQAGHFDRSSTDANHCTLSQH